jgi:peroxiredoxin
MWVKDRLLSLGVSEKFLSSDDVFSATTHYTYEQKGCSRNETEEHESMEERIGEAFADAERLTIMGKKLHAGEAPNFYLDYLDLADLVVRTISLADSAGLVRLLSAVNSLERPVCQRVLHQVLSAQHSEQFGYDFGVWLKEWRLLQQSVFVIDRNDSIVFVEYVSDQLREPDYAAAIQAVQQVAQ